MNHPGTPQVQNATPTIPHHTYITAVAEQPVLRATGRRILPLRYGRIAAVLDYLHPVKSARAGWTTADTRTGAETSLRLEWDNRSGWRCIRGGTAQALAVPLLAAPDAIAVIALELLAGAGNPPPGSQQRRWKHAHTHGWFLGRLDVADTLIALGWRRVSLPHEPLVLSRARARWQLAKGPGGWCDSQLIIASGKMTVYFAETIPAHRIVERCEAEARVRGVEARA